MIEIALRFGWLAQSIVLVSTVILVIYIITSENWNTQSNTHHRDCLLYTSPSPRDRTRSRMPSSA